MLILATFFPATEVSTGLDVVGVSITLTDVLIFQDVVWIKYGSTCTCTSTKVLKGLSITETVTVHVSTCVDVVWTWLIYFTSPKM